jgi:hypothetical protein
MGGPIHSIEKGDLVRISGTSEPLKVFLVFIEPFNCHWMGGGGGEGAVKASFPRGYYLSVSVPVSLTVINAKNLSRKEWLLQTSLIASENSENGESVDVSEERIIKEQDLERINERKCSGSGSGGSLINWPPVSGSDILNYGSRSGSLLLYLIQDSKKF